MYLVKRKGLLGFIFRLFRYRKGWLLVDEETAYTKYFDRKKGKLK